MNILKFKQKILQTFCHCPARVLTGQENNRCQKLSGTRAFTLIELLVVISIIAFLSSVILASTRTAREKAQDSKISQDLRQFAIAEQLYFDEHQSYAFGEENTFAVGNTKNTFSGRDLNIFSTKIAEAVYTDPKCTNFVSSANILVTHKYLSAVPKHPKDDGVSVCYKSTPSASNFVAYSDLISKSDKRVGVILGDITIANLERIFENTDSEYPRSTTGEKITNLALAGDAILSTTGGSSVSIATPEPPPPPPTSSYAISVSKIGNGNVSLSPDSTTYVENTSVTLTAEPSNDNEFYSWGGSCSGTGSTCTLTMDSDKSVTAEFRSSFGQPCYSNTDCTTNICGWAQDNNYQYFRACGSGEAGQLCDSNDQCVSNDCDPYSSLCN